MTVTQSGMTVVWTKVKGAEVRFWIKSEGKNKPFDKFVLSLQQITFKLQNTFQTFVLGYKLFNK